MNIEDFKKKVDGAVNDFTDGVSNGKEFRNAILDILIAVAYPALEKPAKDDKGIRFKPSELLLSYSEFKKLSEEVEEKLHPEDKAWLYAWRFYDLAVSPMDDKERSQIRYGHYIGWFDKGKKYD